MMKIHSLFAIKKFIFHFAVIFNLLLITAFNANAINISITQTGNCSVALSTPGGDGCAPSGKSCNGEVGCICAAKGDFVHWAFGGEEKFKFKFDGDSPLHKNCGKNFKKDKHKCKIKEEVSEGQEYTYAVILQSCAEGTDPRIIIKPR